MARKIIHQLIDDIDGTVIEVGSGETVTFALEGASYEIDLTDDNARRLRDALAPFITAGRRLGGRTGTASKSSSKTAHDLGAIRAWANDNGYTVSDRGRVPGAVIDAYYAAR